MNELLSGGSPRTMLRVSEWKKKKIHTHTHSHTNKDQGYQTCWRSACLVLLFDSLNVEIYHIRPTRRVGSHRSPIAAIFFFSFVSSPCASVHFYRRVQCVLFPTTTSTQGQITQIVQRLPPPHCCTDTSLPLWTMGTVTEQQQQQTQPACHYMNCPPFLF